MKEVLRAVEIVNRLGIVLVFPIENRPEPPSLWTALHPKSRMRWAWDEGADDRVVELWHLREQLARSSEVAYAKWFRGRATFFALPVFHALLGAIADAGDPERSLPRASRDILDLLREMSPRSTKQLRADADLQGKPLESVFQHAMKALWTRLLVVGVGEVEDGAFPSLAVAATDAMFEDLWNARRKVPPRAKSALAAALQRSPAFARELARSTKAAAAPLDEDA